MQLINIYLILSTLLLVLSCKVETDISDEIHSLYEMKAAPATDVQIEKELLILQPNKGQWYYNKKPFTGKAVMFHENGQLAEKVEYRNGKKDGTAEFWYPDGALRKHAFYVENRLDGILKVWSPSPKRQLVRRAQYINGIQEGEQKVWYTNGQLFKKSTLVNGKEEGLQQAWRENGILYINYEAKNGRTFGLKRANLCYQLKNEDVQYE